MLAQVMSVEAAWFHRDLVPVALLRLASDERLVESVRAGSERAFEALFDRHHGPVLAFCRRMLGSSADAEDAMQHTFLAAYRDLMRSQKAIVLRPWLYAIARHRCVSVLRARRERPSDELPDPGVDNLAAEVAAREDVRTTFTDLARLPDDQRAALILAELGDVSHEEIARILGCHRDKVKALVFQARTSLTADRAARETPCADIRAQLATVGGALRHTNLRRHVRECPGCRAFRHELRGDRRGLGLLLPGVGLKRAVLGAVSGSSGAGTGGAALTAGALGGSGLAATALVVIVVAGEAMAGGVDQLPGAVAERAPAARSGQPPGAVRAASTKPALAVVRAQGSLPPEVGNPTGSEAEERLRPRETGGGDTRGAPGDASKRAEATPAPEPASAAGAPERPSGHARPANPGRADGGNSRGRSLPDRPQTQPRGRGADRSAESAAGNRGQKREKPLQPAEPSKENGKPEQAGQDKPSPPAAAPPEHAGPPESSAPPNSASGSGKSSDDEYGHNGGGGKP
jgi:RNA polymerase sigma factor (sigma-70 family)